MQDWGVELPVELRMPRVEYDPRISLGSIVTIAGGILSLVTAVAIISTSYARVDERAQRNERGITEVQTDITDLDRRVYELDGQSRVIRTQLEMISSGLTDIKVDLRRALEQGPRQESSQ